MLVSIIVKPSRVTTSSEYRLKLNKFAVFRLESSTGKHPHPVGCVQTSRYPNHLRHSLLSIFRRFYLFKFSHIFGMKNSSDIGDTHQHENIRLASIVTADGNPPQPSNHHIGCECH